MATGWGAASIPLRIALVVLCLALVVFVIGFATKGWSHRKFASEISVPNLRIPVYVEYELGLWAYDVCYTDRTDYRFGSRAASLARQYYQCTDSDIGGFIRTLPCGDWYHAVQALECLGLILMVAALILLFLYFFVQSIKQRKYLLIITALTFGAVAFIVIGVGVYGSKIKDLHHKLGWSFGVTVGSAVLGFVAGIAELIVLLK
ncbi:uncharacterized protein LOC111130757 [Crassostrea virginica]